MSHARILLADDHDLFREGLAGLINAQPDMETVGQANDGLEALTLARDLKPDLIIMDINMPICDGLEATRLIHSEYPQLPIVMLTVLEDDAKLFDAIRAGARGYLLKNTHSADFLRRVRGALQGEAALPPVLAAHLLVEFARLLDRPAPAGAEGETYDLTSREREVLDLIAIGATDKAIADKLSLSLHTVKTHVRHILAKTHALNRRHAARLAAREK